MGAYVLSNPIPCVSTWTVGFVAFVALPMVGTQNCVLILYVPDMVRLPVKMVSGKFRPCCVTLRAKSMASRFVCGVARLYIPCLADMVTGTVMLTHFLAEVTPARSARRVRFGMCIVDVEHCNSCGVPRVGEGSKCF
jgi:hypothetical protein